MIVNYSFFFYFFLKVYIYLEQHAFRSIGYTEIQCHLGIESNILSYILRYRIKRIRHHVITPNCFTSDTLILPNSEIILFSHDKKNTFLNSAKKLIIFWKKKKHNEIFKSLNERIRVVSRLCAN